MLVRNIVTEISGFPSILYTQNLLICELGSSAASGLSDFHPHQLLNWQSSITLPGPNEGGCFNKFVLGIPAEFPDAILCHQSLVVYHSDWTQYQSDVIHSNLKSPACSSHTSFWSFQLLECHQTSDSRGTKASGR